MKRLVIGIVALLALFSAIRANTESRTGVELGPGAVEISDGRSTLHLGFGLVAADGERRGPWSLLPLRLEYRSGATIVSLSLEGLSFLLGSGFSLGRPVLVDQPFTGDVVSAGGLVTVASKVSGDVWAFGADVVLGPKAEVTGSVVSIGGRVTADKKAKVAGGIHRLAELKLPLLGALGSRSSAIVIALGREVLGFLLAALLAFLLAWFAPRLCSGLGRSAVERWRGSLVSLLVSLVVLPAFGLLLAISVGGVFLLPLIALAVAAAAVAGGLALCARLGGWMRRESQATSLHLFSSALLGLLVVKAPALAGLALALLRAPAAATIGEILRMVSLGATVVLLAWGFGVTLTYARGAAASSG